MEIKCLLFIIFKLRLLFAFINYVDTRLISKHAKTRLNYPVDLYLS